MSATPDDPTPIASSIGDLGDTVLAPSDGALFFRPTLGRNVYVAPTAYVGGAVTLADDVTVMHQVVIRGDIAEIRLGPRCNVQDGAILHTRGGVALEIEEEVSIAHLACVHCRRVGPRTLIGIRATLLDDAEIGADCLIAAGALVTPRTRIPDGKVVMGAPGRIVRDTTPAEREYIRYVWMNYRRLAQAHAAGVFPAYNPLRSEPGPDGPAGRQG